MPKQNLSPARLEAFSDGVIAVIITIMVLELKIPAGDGRQGLQAVLPILLVYLLSFVQTGIYWVNHHYLIDEVETVSHGLLWANLAFLFCLSLIPFATAWLGVKGIAPFATALYAGACVLPGLSYSILWMAVRKRSDKLPHASLLRQLASIMLYMGAIPTAFWHPQASLGMVAIVAVLWLMPPRGSEMGCRDAAVVATAGKGVTE